MVTTIYLAKATWGRSSGRSHTFAKSALTPKGDSKGVILNTFIKVLLRSIKKVPKVLLKGSIIRRTIMTDNNKPPFSKAFVLKTTARHMRKSIDISIRKTFDRMKDFPTDGAKKQEVFETLDVLHKMRKMLDDFQAHNKSLFDDKDDSDK